MRCSQNAQSTQSLFTQFFIHVQFSIYNISHRNKRTNQKLVGLVIQLGSYETVGILGGIRKCNCPKLLQESPIVLHISMPEPSNTVQNIFSRRNKLHLHYNLNCRTDHALYGQPVLAAEHLQNGTKNTLQLYEIAKKA